MKFVDSTIEQTAIRTDLGAIFVSLELSPSATWRRQFAQDLYNVLYR